MNILQLTVRRLLSFAVIAALCVLLPKQSNAQDLGLIDGTWEGKLNWIHGPGILERDYPAQIWRMTLQNNTAQMFIISDGKAKEAYPGKFKVERLRTNVLVYAVTSGRQSDGDWIATSVFILLQKTPDVLGVTTASGVNKPNKPLDQYDSKFFQVQTGEFRRVK